MEPIYTRTLTDFKSKHSRSSNKNKLPVIDTAYLTFYDYERIRKNAYVPNKEELLNNERVRKEQENTQLAKARALKEKIINYDKTKPRTELSNIDRENIKLNNDLLSEAQKILDNNEDCVKEMEKLALYAKVASIRERQLKENKIMEQMFKKKE